MGYTRSAQEAGDAALLTSQAAGYLLAGACRSWGLELESWRVHAVHHRPGAGVSVGYSVRAHAAVAHAGAGEASGTPITDYICLTTAALSHPESALRLEPARLIPGFIPDAAARLARAGSVSSVAGEGRGSGRAPSGSDDLVVFAWRHPADPELPALALACTSSAMSTLLGRQVRPEIVAYRPTRRAVIRLQGEDGQVSYAKVLRPDQAEALRARHAMVSRAGLPVPALQCADARGLLVLAQGQGRSLATLLSRGLDEAGAHAVFDHLLALLDGLPQDVMDLPIRPSWSQRVRHYAHAAATALPEHAPRVHAVAEGVEDLLQRADHGPLVPTHGDFYEANVLVMGQELSGLLDIDSIGPGYRVDDLACLLGHVSVLPHVAPESYPKLELPLRIWTQRAEQCVDRTALHARCAGVALSLVAGARREDGRPWRADAEGRLACAEGWLARAREYDALARASEAPRASTPPAPQVR